MTKTPKETFDTISPKLFSQNFNPTFPAVGWVKVFPPCGLKDFRVATLFHPNKVTANPAKLGSFTM